MVISTCCVFHTANTGNRQQETADAGCFSLAKNNSLTRRYTEAIQEIHGESIHAYIGLVSTGYFQPGI
jgi:hypothetical protein